VISTSGDEVSDEVAGGGGLDGDGGSNWYLIWI